MRFLLGPPTAELRRLYPQSRSYFDMEEVFLFDQLRATTAFHGMQS